MLLVNTYFLSILLGAQIIDMMMLVVDATKGMQTQTAEVILGLVGTACNVLPSELFQCLVIGEIICPRMIIVLNKIDLIPEPVRDAEITKVQFFFCKTMMIKFGMSSQLSKKLTRTLEQTRFSQVSIVPVAAKPGGADSTNSSFGIDKLMEVILIIWFKKILGLILWQVLSGSLFLPVRDPLGQFLFSVDHCFAIRGQGTVMTGTVLSGSVAVNEVILKSTLYAEEVGHDYYTPKLCHRAGLDELWA